MALIAVRETPMAEMNITPLVDVMLVLLVIFMIAAPMMTRTLALTMPGEPRDRSEPPTELTVQVQAGDMFALDGQAMTRRGLEAALASAAASNPDLVVKLDVDPNAEYESALQAMAAARNAGIEGIALPQE